MRRGWIVSVLAVLTLAAASEARAGFIEIGASASYRKTNIDVNAFDESYAYTGSISYYFNASSALELSYTNGQDTRSINAGVIDGVANGQATYLKYETAGLDFVYTFGDKEAALRPYLKAGAVYIISKSITTQYQAPDGTYYAADTESDATGFAPSVGAGFRIALTESLSFKIGVDGWASRPLNDPPMTIDWYGRAGLSWLF